MIVKKIGVIIFSLIFVTTLSLVPIKADEIVSTEIDTYSPTLTEDEQKEIKGAKYLLEYLRQGGSIDLSNKSNGYTAIDLIDDIADFFNGTLAQVLGDEGYWINNISETQVPEYINLKEPKITSEVNMMLGLLPFLNSNELPSPTPNPDTNYSQWLYYINSTVLNDYNTFFWKNGIYSNYNWLTPYHTPITLSGTQISPYINNSSQRAFYNSANPQLSFYSCSNILDINVNSNELFYTFSTPQFISLFSNSDTPRYRTSLWRLYSNTTYYEIDGAYDNNPPQISLTRSGFRNLNDLFEDIAKCFKYVNIYVNGVPWSIVGNESYHIDLGQGTYIENTNQPIQYDYPEPTKIDLTDLIDRLDLLIENQNKIKFPDLSDLIVNENGQQAVAVIVVNKDLTIDDWYVTNYGTLIPLFPVFVDFPVSMTDITTIATIGVKDVIPTDILEILGIGLIGMLFVTWIHRLLE